MNFGGMDVEDVLASAIEPPPAIAVKNALSRLKQLGALAEDQSLTSLGRVLLHLPVEPQIGKLVLYGSFFRCLDSALTLAAIISDRDPFLAPMEKMNEANEIKDSWSPPAFRSDPLAVVSAYNTWYSYQVSGRHREAGDFITANFIHRSTFLNLHKVKEQMYQSLVDSGVIAISGGGGHRMMGPGARRLASMPYQLNTNSDSLPLLAALIAASSAPNFAIRTEPNRFRSAQDKVSLRSILTFLPRISFPAVWLTI
jgi:small subunit ribosomal protein S24e